MTITDTVELILRQQSDIIKMLNDLNHKMDLVVELHRKPPVYIVPADVVEKGWTPPEQIRPDPRPLEVRD